MYIIFISPLMSTLCTNCSGNNLIYVVCCILKLKFINRRDRIRKLENKESSVEEEEE